MNIPYGTDLAETLRRLNLKIVFAESCSAGLAAATLAEVPGISAYLCGSAVTYRIESKVRWLGISADFIEAHTAESPEVSLMMATGILVRTPEADISAAITGHLGPNAPPEKDGIVHVAIARKNKQPQPPTTTWETIKLTQSDRIGRQQEAAKKMLDCIDSFLKQEPSV